MPTIMPGRVVRGPGDRPRSGAADADAGTGARRDHGPDGGRRGGPTAGRHASRRRWSAPPPPPSVAGPTRPGLPVDRGVVVPRSGRRARTAGPERPRAGGGEGWRNPWPGRWERRHVPVRWGPRDRRRRRLSSNAARRAGASGPAPGFPEPASGRDGTRGDRRGWRAPRPGHPGRRRPRPRAGRPSAPLAGGSGCGRRLPSRLRSAAGEVDPARRRRTPREARRARGSKTRAGVPSTGPGPPPSARRNATGAAPEPCPPPPGRRCQRRRPRPQPSSSRGKPPAAVRAWVASQPALG